MNLDDRKRKEILFLAFALEVAASRAVSCQGVPEGAAQPHWQRVFNSVLFRPLFYSFRLTMISLLPRAL
jgi:hypothetical protein